MVTDGRTTITEPSVVFYVYLYIDPRTNVPFYVGKGHGRRAYEQHKWNKQLLGRIYILNELGLKHEVVIAECDDEDHAFREEQKLIQCYGRKDLGFGPLLNHSNGGEGRNGSFPTEATRLKMRLAKLGKPRAPSEYIMTDEHKRNLGKHMRGTKHAAGKRTPEQCARMSIAQCKRRALENVTK